MASTSSALRRLPGQEAQTVAIDESVARDVAQAWSGIAACEDALAGLETGIVAWRAAPAVQTAMAASLAGLIRADDSVMTLGFQPYAWAWAAGTGVDDILAVQLGKALPEKMTGATLEDMTAALKAGSTAIMAIHADTVAVWDDVRALAAAAVRKEAPVLILVSAAVSAPGASVDVIGDWAQVPTALREALEIVRDKGAIRVVAVADMDVATVERAVMEGAGIAPLAWSEKLQKNADGAVRAINAAYMAPVRSF